MGKVENTIFLAEKYEVSGPIEGGSFSVVYKCRNCDTGKDVAVKWIVIMDELEGFPSSVLREISILKEMKHDNIVRLLDVQIHETNVYLIFEYLELDLRTFIADPKIPKDSHLVKIFLHQILSAVAYLHSHKILHRDLKPENLLIDRPNNKVKVADFGSAREFGSPVDSSTFEVASLWYRAPELLLGHLQYSTSLDIWAVGCIFGEMVTQHTLFNGYSGVVQLFLIYSLLGSPNEENWPGVTALHEHLSYMRRIEPKNLAQDFSGLEPAGVDLLSKMLQLDPSKRITAHAALEHEYFTGVWSGLI